MKRNSIGDAMFGILKFYCHSPTDQLYSQRTALDALNKGIEIDAPYYGYGQREIEILIEEGYLCYWDNKYGYEEKHPDYEKSLLPTPKAFELIEARKNRIATNKAINVAIFVGALSIALNIMIFYYEISHNLSSTFLIGLPVIAFIIVLLLRLK